MAPNNSVAVTIERPDNSVKAKSSVSFLEKQKAASPKQFTIKPWVSFAAVRNASIRRDRNGPAFTMFVGISFPFFGGLLGFFGGFAFSPTKYFLPCVIWLAIKKPRRFSSSWFINWICITLGVLLMILSPIGGLRHIILQAKDHHFYN